MNHEDKGDLALEAASATGALIGLSLSFTALSPLVIGGIVSFSSITTFLILALRLSGVKILKDKKTLILGCIRTIVAPVLVTVFGVTFGDIINSDVMLGMWIALLTSAGMRMVERTFHR